MRKERGCPVPTQKKSVGGDLGGPLVWRRKTRNREKEPQGIPTRDMENCQNKRVPPKGKVERRFERGTISIKRKKKKPIRTVLKRSKALKRLGQNTRKGKQNLNSKRGDNKAGRNDH